MSGFVPSLGVGIGWRPDIALFIERRTDLGFVEVVAEDLDPNGPLPAPIAQLRRRGIPVVPHGVSLSLGSAEPPQRKRLENLARLAERLEAPLVSEHITFVRGGGLESGHLLPVARTRESLRVLVDNIRQAKQVLKIPLALENIATFLEWPASEMDEATFLREVLEQTDTLLLLDVENVYANSRNHGFDPLGFLESIPLNRIAYVHVAGGIKRDGLYHDTHAHKVPAEVLELLAEVANRVTISGVMLERDDRFPSDGELNAELDAIRAALNRAGATVAPGM